MSKSKRSRTTKGRSEPKALRDKCVALTISPEAVENLRSDLEDTLVVFAQDKLDGQLATLWVIYRALDALGIDARLRAPLYSLIGDLQESDRQGAEKAISDAAPMAVAAATLDTLVKAGMKRQEAAREVAKLASPAMSADQIVNFRKNLQGGHVRPEVIKFYQALIQQSAEQWGHLKNQERIKEALRGVRNVNLSLLGRE